MLCAAAAIVLLAAPSATASETANVRQVVTYRSLAKLERSGARVVRTLPARLIARFKSPRRVGAEPVLRRALTVDETALAETYQPGVAWEWQWKASRMDEGAEWVRPAAAS